MKRWTEKTPDPTGQPERTFSCRRIDFGNATTLEISGVLDAMSTVDLRPVIEWLVTKRRTPVTVDLSKLKLIDSSGVGALVSIYKRVRAEGGQVYMVGVNGQPLEIFRLLQIERILCPSPRR